MTKNMVVAVDNICPDCSGKLVYLHSEGGYFCDSEDCKYFFNNSQGLCFVYFEGQEFLTRSQSFTRKERKNKANKVRFRKRKSPGDNKPKFNPNIEENKRLRHVKERAKLLSKIESDYQYQFECRLIESDDTFYNAYVPFVEAKEVKEICGVVA